MSRYSIALVASALILSVLLIQGAQVWASPSVNGAIPTRSRVVSTDHMTVQLTFPDSVYPGQSITIKATTNAKSNGRIIRLSIDIFSFSLVDNQLTRLASQTIVTDEVVKSGDNWQSSLVVVIPTYAPPGPLIGTLTEVWQVWRGAVQETPNYYSDYYSSCYCRPYSNYPYYYSGPSYRTYTYTYNTHEYVRYPSGFTVLRTTPHDYALRYTYEPALYYPPSHAPQVSSEQTFPLTYVLRCNR